MAEESGKGIKVVLQTSLGGVPPGAQVHVPGCHPNVTVKFFKKPVFFTAKGRYVEFGDVYLPEKYQVYTEDNTLIPDGHILSKYGVSESSTLYLREEGVRRIFVLWKQEWVEVWVKAKVRVGAIIETVWKKLSSKLGLEAGSPDMYDLLDAHSNSESKVSSTSLLTVQSFDQEPALPRDKTLEQLGFGESPELQLREKSRSRAPSVAPGSDSRASSLAPEKSESSTSSLISEPNLSNSNSSCDRPGMVTISTQKVTSSSFHITWNRPTAELCIDLDWYHAPVETTTGPITAYILEFNENASGAPSHAISLTGVTETYTVTGLKPHTEYYVRVAAENTAGRGPFCERVLVQTAPDTLPVPTAPPSEVKIVPDYVTSTSFLITWCPSPVETIITPITAHILEYVERGCGAPPYTISLSGMVEEYKVTGLKPHTEYYVRVAAENTAGRGPFCERELVQTAPDISATPPSEVNIVLGNVTSTSFLVTWCPPPVETISTPITAYILEYGEAGSGAPSLTISLSGVVEEYTVTGLKPHTEYDVRVAAENTAGRGPFCEPVPVQTAPDIPTDPPSEVKIVPDNVTSTSFLVTWCPPPVETVITPITAYILEYVERGSGTPPHTISLSGMVEEYTVTGLKPHTEYYVRVAAENTAGRGPFCERELVQTAPDISANPPSEVNIMLGNVTSTDFLVTWCPPPVETVITPITAYILEYGEAGSGAPPHTISLSGVVEEYTVTGLKPHTEYYVRVAAENTAGRSPFCKRELVQTAPDKPVAAPDNVQLEVSEDKPSIFVSWSHLEPQYYNSDALTGYHVRYTSSSKECRGGTVDVQPDQTSCTLDFLDTGVAYAVSVAAANHVGTGPYSFPSVAIVGAPPDEDDEPRIERIVHRVTQILDNLAVVPPSGRDLPVKHRLIYIAIMDLTVLPYLVDIEQTVGITISELCSLLRLRNPSEWYLSRSHGLQVLMSGKSQFQPAVGLSRKKSKRGKKPYFSVGTALSSSLDCDYLLDVTKTWAETEFQSEPCIVHMRPWASKVVKISEDVDFGVVEDAELGQQVHQPWYRVTQGHHPVNKSTAAEIAALMCMCQAEQVDGKPDSEANVDSDVISYLPSKLQRKKSMRKAAAKKYREDKTATKEAATSQLRQCVDELPAANGVFFEIKVPGKAKYTAAPKLKKGVFGVGPKEIAYGCYDGDTVEVMTRRDYSTIKCFHASEDSFTVDFGAHGIEAFQASTPRAFDIMHIFKIYIQQQHFLDEPPAIIPQSGPTDYFHSYNSYPALTEADVLNPYWNHEHPSRCSH